MTIMKLCFLGDISYNDKGIQDQLNISQFLNFNLNSDVTIANLEALASIGEVNLLKNPRVTTSVDALENLKKLGVHGVTLAHNHVYDAKLSGFKTTLKKLDELNIAYLGAGLTKEDAERPLIIKSDGLKIGLLNYCHQDTNPSLPENCEVYLNEYHKSKIEIDIRQLRARCDHVVLILHWGGRYEGGYFPDQYQLKDAKDFSKAGASLIVGHHPHTLQPSFKIGSTPVYFSLGNFIFYDVMHDGKTIKLSPRRKNGGVLHVEFNTEKRILDRLYFSRQNKSNLMIAKRNLAYNIRSRFFARVYSYKVFYQCYKFSFTYVNALFYFVFIQEGGLDKYKNLNLNKIKRFLWKK